MTFIVTARFAAQCFDSFLRYDWNHDECSYRIGPPPAEQSAQYQARFALPF
jgi:hypothetical protein